MQKRWLFLLLGLFYITTVSAQEFSCASDVIEQSMITMYPEYAHDRAQLESFTQQRMNNTHARMLNFGCQPTASIYYIPIVCHVMHLGESVGVGSNIPDSQIINTIARLNSLWLPFGIQFVLAKQDPNGVITTGITRTNCNGVSNYAQYGIDPRTNPTGAPDTTIKRMSIWPWQNYVNLWIVSNSPYATAYANMPSSNYFQGVVVNHGTFRVTSGGFTLSHELGHYFNLYHTFQGSNGTTCALNNNPYSDGDKCPDTPPVLQTDCNNGSCGSFPNINNSLMNNMGYCYRDSSIFTSDQKTRVVVSLLSEYRWSLVTSPGLIPINIATEVSIDSIGFEQDLNQPLCNGWLIPKARFKNYGQTANSIELMLSVNNSDTIFTIYPGLLRGSESLISLIPVKFTSSGTNNIEIIVRKVNGVTDYNQLNNNLCIDVDVIVQTITISTGVNIIGAGTLTGSGNFSCNGVVDTLRATENLGYVFQSITEGSTVISTSRTFPLPIDLSRGNRTFIANFAVATYSVSATANPSNGGTVTSGPGTYNYGATPVVTFKAKAGYKLTNVTENAVIVSTDSSITLPSLTGNRNLIGNFVLKTFAINVVANGVGGSVSGGGPNIFYGSSTTVTATEFGCYTFTGWYENGLLVFSNKTYTFTVTGARNLEARFSQKRYTISLSANDINKGTATGSGSYGCDTSVTVRAHIKTGAVWQNWTENGNIVSTDSVYSFTASANRSLVANFTAATYTIAIAANIANAGTLTGGGSITYGTTAGLQANASTCYTFKNWTENGNIVSTNANYSFTVNSNRNLVANFTKKQYLISLSPNDINNGTVSGGGTYGCDTSVTVRAKIKAGARWLNWTENSNIVSADSVYTFTASANRNLVANFEQVITAIKQTTINEISKIYPNPANTILQIEIKSKTATKINLTILDLTGRIIEAKSLNNSKGILNTSFDVSKLSKGNYYLNLSDEEGVASYPFVVQ